MAESTKGTPGGSGGLLELHQRLRKEGFSIRYGKIVVQLFNPETARTITGAYPDRQQNLDGSLDLVGLEDAARQIL